MKPASTSARLTWPRPNSRIPGESINSPPPGKWNNRAVVVVWVPWPDSSDNGPTRVSTSGSRLLTSDDLPTPDWPTNTLMRPSSCVCNCSMPLPWCADTSSTG
ncbi:hypothetical protein D3C84_925780 [compost metagenome]